MTEKRFHKGDWSNNICEVYDDENYIGGVQLNCADEFISLLNRLNEENEQLKKQLDSEHTMLDNAILLERTRMGKNSLQQYKEAIQ